MASNLEILGNRRNKVVNTKYLYISIKMVIEDLFQEEKKQ